MSFSPSTQSWLQEAIEDFLIEKVRESISLIADLKPNGEKPWVRVDIHSRDKEEIVLRWCYNPMPEKYYMAKEGYEVFTIVEALRKFITYKQREY